MNAVTNDAFEAAIERAGLGALGGIEMRLSVEIGATRLTLAELAELEPGEVIELDRRSDERIDILVNDRLLAKGEVVTIGDRFGVRIVELVDGGAR
ncbi:flagellar motor switch protein FliN [Sphingosinicellaceae bacterium]|nr:flagellar motor switch protein FliN [Sphingosinicellaceae bacterium]